MSENKTSKCRYCGEEFEHTIYYRPPYCNKPECKAKYEAVIRVKRKPGMPGYKPSYNG